MRDYGLLASMVLVLAIPALLVRPSPEPAAGGGLLDRVGGALAVGLIVGRLATVAIDDRRLLTSLPDLLVIRSGVEFWPGVVAGLVWLGWVEHRSGRQVEQLLAIVAPAGLLGWAVYEASCLLRDGCPGPVSSIGLRPDGLLQRQFPVGLVVAFLAALAAYLVDRAHQRGLGDVDTVFVALAVVALIRTLASFWLPKVGVGLTRQHKTSITVLVICAFVLLAHRRRRPLPAP